MNSDLNLPPDMKPLTHSTQPPTKTSSPHINQPESNQQNDQPESVASVSPYLARMQVEFDEECKHYEQHLRQTCVEFASIQKQIIEFSLILEDEFLTESKLQQQLKQAKEDKAAHLSLYGLEMTATENAIDTMKSNRAQETNSRDQLVKDINDLGSTDLQIDSINQEIDKNSKSIEELKHTLEKHMRALKLKADPSYLNNINDVLALKAEIADLNQVILKKRDEQRDQLIPKDANIAAIREGPSSATPNSIEELLHLLTAPQGSPMLVSLTSLDLSKCKLGDMKAEFFKALFDMPNLTSLNLNGTGIGADGVKVLATSTALTNLTSLDLGGNKIEAAGAEALAASKTLTNLTSLDLYGNSIGAAGVQALAASTTLTNLTSLNLLGNSIGVAGAQALAASTTLTNITSLNLSYNNIGDDGAEALATSATFTKLTSFNLSWNSIGAAGAEALAASTTLINLTSLDLGGNKIEAAGVQALAASKTLTNLTSLMLRDNSIGVAGAEALAASKTLTNLTSLDLYGNSIGAAGVQALAASETLTNLTSLMLRDNSIGAAGVQAIRTKYPFALVYQ